MYTAKNGIRPIGVACVVLVAVLAGALATFGQGAAQPEPSYQVSLQFVMGSNDGGKGELPANLADIARELKKNFGLTNYRVAGTLLGRVGNNGNYEYRSVSNIFGMETASTTPTFLEWTIAGVHGVTSEKGRGLEGSAFRFGARVPVFGSREDGGKPSVSYEQVGVTAMRFGFAENTPTLIGTLSLPNTPGTVFLVVTAHAAE
jgi:hypothetical protein